MLNNIVMKA